MKKLAVAALILVLPVTALAAANSEQQAETAFSLALFDASEGRYTEAAATLEKIVSSGVTNQNILQTLGEVYLAAVTRGELLQDSGSNQLTLSRAESFLNQSLTVYPQNKKLLYLLAEVYRRQSSGDQFSGAIGRILKIDPHEISANFWMGEYHYLNKRYDEAMPFFLAVVTGLEPDNEQELMAYYHSCVKLGVLYTSQGNYQLAAHYLEKARKLYSRDSDLLRQMAYLYAHMLDFEACITAWKQIPDYTDTTTIVDLYAGVLWMKKSPDLGPLISARSAESPYLRALDAWLKKDYLKARAELAAHKKELQFSTFYDYALSYEVETALTNSARAAQDALLAGSYARSVGRHSMAVLYFKQLETNKNALPEILWQIASTYDDMEEYASAAPYYERFLKDSDGGGDYRTTGLVRLAYIYNRLGNREKGQNMLSEAKKSAVNKDDIYQVYFYSGLAAYNQKNYKQAIADFDKARLSKPDEPRLLFYTATLYYEQKDMESAVKYLKTALAKDPDNAEINNLLAYIYSLQKVKLPEAIALVQKALTVSPDNIAYLDTLGWVYYQAGDYQKAFETFNRVLTQITDENTEDGMDEVYEHLGMVFEKMGDKETAAHFYKKSRELKQKKP